MLIIALTMLAQSGPVAATPVEIDPTQMSQAQIKAHNQPLARRDPEYIRCIRYAAPGSLIENKLKCRTNAQWVIANRKGEDNARDTVDAMRSRLESPPEDVCKDPETC